MAVKLLAAKPGPALIVLDSSCWIEYFRDTPRADLFASVAEASERLIVPTITIYEVTKKMRRELDTSIAAFSESVMCRGRVIDIDLATVRQAVTFNLPLADSLIYAIAQAHKAILWTQDAHFEGLAGVRYFAKTSLAQNS